MCFPSQQHQRRRGAEWRLQGYQNGRDHAREKTNAELKLRDNIVRYCDENNINYEIYLPITIQVKQWSDRQVTKKIPLFRNYIFVKHDDGGFDAIKKLPGFSNYIRFGRYPSIIPEQQITLIESILNHQQKVVSQPTTLVKGEPVMITKGPFVGNTGFLLEDQRQTKVAIEIRHLKQCLHVIIPLEHVQRVH